MIKIKSKDEIKKMREGGKKLAAILKKVSKKVKPGVNLLALEEYTDELIAAAGAEPSFKNYKGYPSSVCISVNEEVVHCAPRDYLVKEGDLVSLDCGLLYKGMYTDMALTIPVGMVSLKAQRLVKVTKKALLIGLQEIKADATVGDIGAAIQAYVEAQEFGVVTQLVGHGVGHEVHEEPRIPNYGKAGSGEVLKEGMCLAIEPMVNLGDGGIVFEEDGWRVTTKDHSLSAHFEVTLVVTKKGFEILTK